MLVVSFGCVNENAGKSSIRQKMIKSVRRGLVRRERREILDVRRFVCDPRVGVDTTRTLGKDAGSGLTLGASRKTAGSSCTTDRSSERYIGGTSMQDLHAAWLPARVKSRTLFFEVSVITAQPCRGRARALERPRPRAHRIALDLS
jgi:hypothetical protein